MYTPRHADWIGVPLISGFHWSGVLFLNIITERLAEQETSQWAETVNSIGA